MITTLLKYTSLVTLTLQSAVMSLSIRYARTRAGDIFISSTAVVMSEVVKLFTCLVFVYQEEGRDIKKTVKVLNDTVLKQPIDTLKVCVPSLIYIIQNNLFHIAASHLDVTTNQITYQLKILTTAMFAVLILQRSLLPLQWCALVILVTGVVMVQLTNIEAPHLPSGLEQNRLLGFGAALTVCLLSGFAGIYFEKILKESDISVWMRNVQHSLLSLPFGLITCFLSHGTIILNNGFFFGYDAFVWYVVVLQAGGGLVVAIVVKYADNILKGFATSLAIIISCIASVILFNFHIKFPFVIGAFLVMSSIFMYDYKTIEEEPESEQNPEV